MVHDCIVLGLGGMGSCVLRELAARGVRVLGIDRHGPVHDRGSSHGRTRIIRQAYFEHPDYVPLLRRAYELWSDLEGESARPLYRPCGVLLSGPGDGEAVPGSLRAAREHGLDVERLDAATARRRFPLLAIPEDHAVVLERDAGCLFVEDCVRTALDSAVRLGAGTRFHEPVLEWRPEGTGITLVTASGRHHAHRLVITAGAWFPGVSYGAFPPIVVRKKQQLWYAVKNESRRALEEMPAFYQETRQGAFYGIPAPPDGELKVARHSSGAIVEDPSRLDDVDADEERRAVEAFVTGALSGVTTPAVRSAPCMYSMSPDGHFLVDRHPDCPQVYLAAGFSGHGFKFAPVIGEALSDLVLQGETSLPIEFLGLGRFASH